MIYNSLHSTFHIISKNFWGIYCSSQLVSKKREAQDLECDGRRKHMNSCRKLMSYTQPAVSQRTTRAAEGTQCTASIDNVQADMCTCDVYAVQLNPQAAAACWTGCVPLSETRTETALFMDNCARRPQRARLSGMTCLSTPIYWDGLLLLCSLYIYKRCQGLWIERCTLRPDRVRIGRALNTPVQ